MAVLLKFNERKATQAAALLLRLRGGRMSYLKLVKLLYIADRQALLKWGRPISTDMYFSLDHGPVLSRILDLTSEGQPPEIQSVWANSISSPSNYNVDLLNNDAGDDELSEAETKMLESVFAEWGNKYRWDLVKYTHTFPEWKDPKGGRMAISYRDILKAGGKSEDDIVAIEDELRDLAEAERLFSKGILCAP